MSQFFIDKIDWLFGDMERMYTIFLLILADSFPHTITNANSAVLYFFWNNASFVSKSKAYFFETVKRSFKEKIIKNRFRKISTRLLHTWSLT